MRKKIKFLVGFLWVITMLQAGSLVGSIDGDLQVSNGTASYSLPLTTPEDNFGLAPALSVGYTQGGGNGILGLGFKLGGLSSISKCVATKRVDGIRGGIAFDERDKYCLDGQRLIEIGTSEYRLYNSKQTKIKRFGSAANPSYWKVWNAKGYIIEYGRESQSKSTAPAGTLSWKVTSVSDRFGHKALYAYKQHRNSTLIEKIEYGKYRIEFVYGNRADTFEDFYFGKKRVHDKLLAEVRTYADDTLFYSYKIKYNSIDTSKNRYRYSKVENITYCDKDGSCLKPVTFEYKREEIAEKVREDILLNVDKLLSYVVADLNRDGYNDICYYDGGLKCSLGDGDGGFSVASKWTSALDVELPEDMPTEPGKELKAKKEKSDAIASTLTLLDINHDYAVDYCAATPKGIFCGVNSGNNSFKNNKYYTTKFTVEDAYRLVDIDHDDDIDICAFKAGKIECVLNVNGTMSDTVAIVYDSAGHKGFPLQQTFTYDYYHNGNEAKRYKRETEEVKIPQPKLLDINNDGYVDVCGLRGNDYYCAIGKGYDTNRMPKFGRVKSWGNGFPMGNNSRPFRVVDENRDQGENQEFITKQLSRTMKMADLNSDGLVDICYRKESEYICRINSGTGFGAPRSWLHLPSATWMLKSPHGQNEINHTWLIATQENSISLEDVDGDGVVDFRAVVNDDLVYAPNINGRFERFRTLEQKLTPDYDTIDGRKSIYTRPIKKWFGLKTEFHNVYVMLAYGPVKQVADTDGENNKEICYRSIDGLSCVKIKNQPIALLEKVTNSLGMESRLKYGRVLSDNLYAPQSNARSPLRDTPVNAFVVSSITTDNGIGGTNEMQYRYEGYKSHDDRGGLGFAKITQYNRAKKTKSIAIFNRSDSLLNGKVIKTEGYVDNQLISVVENEYEAVEEASPKSGRVLLKKSTHKNYSLKGALLSTKVAKNNHYNAYDQIEESAETLADSTGLDYTIKTETQYKNDTSGWILGKPTDITVAHTNSGNTITKHTTFEYADTGELIKQVLEPEDPLALTTEYSFNNDRTKKSTTVHGKNGESRVSYTHYDNDGRVVATRNTLGHKESMVYDSFCNKPSKVTGINGLKTIIEYDGQCRKTKQVSLQGTEAEQTVEIFYDWSDGADIALAYTDFDVPDRDNSVYMVTSRSSTGQWSRVYYDALERKVREVSQGTEDTNGQPKKVLTDYAYDARGNLLGSTVPYFESVIQANGVPANWLQAKWVTLERDVLGRTVKQTQPSKRGDIVTTMSYDGYKLTVVSPERHTKTTHKNALDQTIEIVENDGSTILFGYDPSGNLVKTDANGKTTTLEYDKFNRKQKMTDISLGAWHYHYNAFGELTKETDAKGQVTSIAYDVIGRVETKTQAGQTTSFLYDTAINGIGKLASSGNGLVRKEYSYDAVGRVQAVNQSVDNRDFQTSYRYDEASRVNQVTFPGGMSLSYNHELNGMLESVTVPKKDVWDYDYVQLEKALEETIKYIYKLEEQAASFEEKVNEYSRKAAYYRSMMHRYINKGRRLQGQINSLYRTLRKLKKQTNWYQRKANSLRKTARYYKKRFRRATLTYVRTVGGKYYYKRTRCTSRNWKGHCRRRSHLRAYVPRWIVRGRSKYCVRSGKGRRSCRWGPKRHIIVSDEYNRAASRYQRVANRVEQRKKSNIRKTAWQIRQRKLWLADAKAAAARYHKQAKYYAELAKKEATSLNEIAQELQSQKKAANSLQTTINERLHDETNIPLWVATSRSPQGEIQGELYGNGLLTTRYYDPSGTIDRVKTGMGEQLIRDIRYGYDGRNNIVSKSDALHDTTERYAYDALDRIDAWQYKRGGKHTKTLNRTYRYDIDGNIDFKTGIGEMTYNNKNQLTSAGGDADYHYDANGNMLKGNGKTYSYTPFNKVRRIAYQNGYQDYTYDESDTVIKKEYKDGRVVYYIGDSYELSIEETPEGTKESMKHHIRADGKVVATHEKTLIADRKQVDKTAYVHRDALGSVDTVTDNYGAIVLRNEYTPYGENIENLQGNHLFKQKDLRGYTGHKQIPEANLIDMNARIYDPVIARFTSPDTMIPHPDTIQAYNRYAYVYGNPIKYTDPSGHFIQFILGAVLFTVAATSDIPTFQKVGMLVGRMMMMGSDMGLSGLTQGATVGFTTGFISSGGDLGEAITSSVTSAMGAEMSFQIGHGMGLEFGEQALAHGISQGTITVLRGGSFQSGFISGFVGKITGGALHAMGINGDNAGETIMGTAITATFGGLASEASGGSFTDGAVSAAVVYLYNELKYNADKYGNAIKKIMENDLGLKVIFQLETSKQTYTIRDSKFMDDARYYPDTKTILATSDMTALVFLKHGIGEYEFHEVLFAELAHAYRHDTEGKSLYNNFSSLSQAAIHAEEMHVIKNYENRYTGLNRINHYHVTFLDRLIDWF